MAVDPNQMATSIGNAPESNPLGKFFRTPGIYLRLPSGGNFWPAGSIDFPETGEIPVYSMTARDEILLNNPDALMNGQAVVDVIQSCCPNIRDAWSMPGIDLDAVLIAIRIASYGESMDFNSTCPACTEENSYSSDLRPLLDKVTTNNKYAEEQPHLGLTFKFKPQPYRVINMLNLETFETNRMFSVINNAELEDQEKMDRVNAIFKKMTDYTVGVVSGGIQEIITPDGQEVTRQDHIDEFVKNCDRTTFKWIQDTLSEIGNASALSELDIECPNCGNKYSTPMTFDQANFFGSGS